MINTLTSYVMPLCSGIGRLLFPAVCLNCSGNLHNEAKGLCPRCWESLRSVTAVDLCPRCASRATAYAVVNGRCPQCQKIEYHFDSIAGAGEYMETLRTLILALKFHEKTETLSILSQILRAVIDASPFADQIDFFVAIPSHWTRNLFRPASHTKHLLKSLGAERKKISTDLVRIKRTSPQWRLSPAKRRKNIKGAFAVRPGHKFTDKNICLIDDITTSRATLDEAARVLKEGGARKVFAAVLAVSKNVDVY